MYKRQAPASQPASSQAQTDKEPVTILVAAAASLEYSYTEQLIPMFQDQYPWITVEGTYDLSLIHILKETGSV